MKNVCIVGYGAIGPVHAKAFSAVDNARLYAICDENEARLSKGAVENRAAAYTSFDEMLCDKSIDSVHVCTPHYLHYEMIKRALDAGKSVVAEKPVTMERDEFYSLMKHKNADKICVVFQNRLNPCVKVLKEMTDARKFGELICAKGILTWQRTAEYYAQDEWRGKWNTEGGGVLINQAVHTLDLMSYIGGEMECMKACMNNFSLENIIEVEDTFCSYLKYQNGAKGIFFATNAYGENTAPELQFVFEKAMVRYIDGKLFVNGVLECEDVKAEGEKGYWGNSHIMLIKRFYDEGKYFSLNDVKNTVDIMFDMYGR